MSRGAFSRLGLGLVLATFACARTKTGGVAVLQPPVASAPATSTTPEEPMTASPASTLSAPAIEHRVSWYGLSLDIGDTWRDDTSYTFEGPQQPLEKLSFSISDIKEPQVSAWLEEVRKRVDGAYGARPSTVQPYENADFTAQGVRIEIKTEYLYDIFVSLEEEVLNISATCRAECDATVRGIVASLKRPGLVGAAADPNDKSPHYTVMGLVFDSSQPLDAPNRFSLEELGFNEVRNPNRVFCSRTNAPPDDNALPSAIDWAFEANAALTKVPRTRETLTSAPGNTGTAATVQLYRREGFVPDELGNLVFASTSSAVIATGSDFYTCDLRALPSSPALLTSFHRLFEHARRQ